MIKTEFKFEGQIQNASKVMTFIRNHTDNDDNPDEYDEKNNVSPGGDIISI